MTKFRRRVHKLELDLLLVLSGHVGDQTLQKVQKLHMIKKMSVTTKECLPMYILHVQHCTICVHGNKLGK